MEDNLREYNKIARAQRLAAYWEWRYANGRNVTQQAITEARERIARIYPLRRVTATQINAPKYMHSLGHNMIYRVSGDKLFLGKEGTLMSGASWEQIEEWAEFFNSLMAARAARGEEIVYSWEEPDGCP